MALLFQLQSTSSVAYPFSDVSIQSGLRRPFGPRIKYGGASVADLDGDGHPDLILGHHDDRSLQVYFNNGDGTFTISPFSMWRDTHALTPTRLSPRRKTMNFLLSRGGAFGTKPNPPIFIEVQSNRSLIDVTEKSGLSINVGRGRSSLFVTLKTKHRARLDCILFNAVPITDKNFLVVPHQKAFLVTSDGSFVGRSLTGGLEIAQNSYGTVTDVDGDGRLEIVSFQNVSIWKVDERDNFKVEDISRNVLPATSNLFSTVSIAELDYDNDGRWDLFISRSTTGELKWLNHRRNEVHNVLLRNIGGKYVAVTQRVGIDISGTASRGVTAGDFNNDGYIDILISQYTGHEDILYMNRNGKKFQRVNPGFNRSIHTVAGDAPTAVDFDGDGRLDVVLSEGDWFNKSTGGFYKLMKNENNVGKNFLLVRVQNAPGRRATSMYAIVKVQLNKKKFMIRRVGSPGSTVSNSYIERLHFGMGNWLFATNVSVTWMDGTVRFRQNVRANSSIKFGVI